MKNKILIILPSRCGDSDRTSNVERFIENWKENTEGYSDLCLAIDEDEKDKYKEYDNVILDISKRERLAPKLNYIALKYCDKYKYIAFFGDDHIIKTKWESEFLNFFIKNNTAILYGNDLLQRSNLPTAVCLSSNIITTIGYIVPIGLKHMFIDNFWYDLGNSLKILKYFNNVIFEHLHPANNKSKQDSQYEIANQVFNEDYLVYDKYLKTQFPLDVKKLKNVLTK